MNVFAFAWGVKTINEENKMRAQLNAKSKDSRFSKIKIQTICAESIVHVNIRFSTRSMIDLLRILLK